MTKNELIKKIAECHKDYSQKDIALVVQTVIDSLTSAMKKNERIEIRGFGMFTVRERRPRIGRNPKSGIAVDLKERKVPFFKTGKDLRLKVDRKNEL